MNQFYRQAKLLVTKLGLSLSGASLTMSPLVLIASVAFGLGIMANSPLLAASTSVQHKPQSLKTTKLTVYSERGRHNFTVELALSEAEQNQGLMFRRELADDYGMLFPINPPRPVAFWMKNTYVPLDIIYIGKNYRIIKIIAAKPLDLTPLPSEQAIVAVLEIEGGQALKRGIKLGDTVKWSVKARSK